VFAYYSYLFAPSDPDLAAIERTCKSGERLCGDCKSELADRVGTFLKAHQEAREKARSRLDDFLVRD
jgi:tryptophanyl-tRNA synthetase